MPAGRYGVEVDFEACKACGYCASVCPVKVFAQGTDINKKGYAPYRAVKQEACTGCLRCFYMCPDFCLEVTGSARAGNIGGKT
ncbi:MAG: 4Fe-4S binding protein [Desulfovibrio sp.]|jgi:NAD-dependent dihydropyrimidine dehydrogenase PreA subunit|nr:4Fe-4S binding protein [Desulfovibrio sp.]